MPTFELALLLKFWSHSIIYCRKTTTGVWRRKPRENTSL